MKEKLNEALDIIDKRISSPFLFSYLVAACLINYRIVPVLFSQEHYKKSFEYIDTILYPNPFHLVASVFFLPTAVAAIYTFVWPWFEPYISVASQRLANRKLRLVLREEREIPIDSELQEEFFKNHDLEMESLKIKIIRLKDEREKNQKSYSNKVSRLEQVSLHSSIRRLFPEEFSDQCVELMKDPKLSMNGEESMLLRIAQFPNLMGVLEFLRLIRSNQIKEDDDGIRWVDVKRISACFGRNNEPWKEDSNLMLLEGLGLISMVPNTDGFNRIRTHECQAELLLSNLQERLNRL